MEQDVLRKRMEDKWKGYFESQPKFSANWDRSAKRPPAPVVREEPKPKPKPRPKQKPKPATPPTPEIVFVTPPLTPPPAPPEIVELPKEFQKDDDFWNFFDQSVPT